MKIKIKNYSFLLALGVFVMISITYISVANSAARPPKGFSIDPAAVALFNRSAKFYASQKTLRLRWKTTDEGPNSIGRSGSGITTMNFIRPDHFRVEFKNTNWHFLYLVDGKSILSLYRDGAKGKPHYSQSPLIKDKKVLEHTLSSLMWGGEVAGAMSYWLQGQHSLQAAQLKDFRLPEMSIHYYEAKKLKRASWKGHSWDRVRVRYGYDPKSEMADDYVDMTFWLAQDNARLGRIQQDIDDRAQEHEIIEQTFNAPIPASSFVFKIPKGAKKE